AGEEAESVALRLVVGALERLADDDIQHFRGAVADLRTMLADHFEGEGVAQLTQLGLDAESAAADAPRRRVLLERFVHLSRVSDGFGCDLLAWLPDAAQSDPRPLLVEVKRVSGQ